MIHEDNYKIQVFEVLKKVVNQVNDKKQEVILEQNLKEITNIPKRVDIVLRNLKLIIEVEPDKTKAFSISGNYGKSQVKNYANIIFKGLDYQDIYCAVAYFDKDENKIKVYLFRQNREGDETKLFHNTLPEFEKFLLDNYSLFQGDVPPITPEIFNFLFLPLLSYSDNIKEVLKEYINLDFFKPLYQAYSNAIKIICGDDKLNDDKILEMYSIHTLLQAIVIGIIKYVFNKFTENKNFIKGSELNVSITLPFLEWYSYLDYKLGNGWKGKEIFDKISKDIFSQVIKLDWSKKNREVFRLLYEEFIPQKYRWEFGEYYTPPWLVNFLIEKLKKDIIENLVLDPFCGSGTFLDYSFRTKVNNNIPADEAIYSIIGFDVNPLAVILSRAELLLSYYAVKQEKEEEITDFPIPLVFYINSAEIFTKQGTLFLNKSKKSWLYLYEVEEILNLIEMQNLGSLDLRKLVQFEIILFQVLKRIHEEEIKKASEIYNEIPEKIKSSLDFNKLKKFVEKYGNGAWTIAISSLIAKNVVFNIPKDKLIVISNPPWKSLDEVKGDYAKGLSVVAKTKNLNKAKYGLKEKALSQALAKGNIASIFLAGWKDVSKRIAFVVPETVAYDGKNYGIGKLLTFNALNGKATVYRINADVFKHGEKCCVVFDGGDLIFNLSLNETMSKYSEKLNYSEKKVKEFTAHIMEVIKYFFSENIKTCLGVTEILQGAKINRISGLFREKNRAGLFMETTATAGIPSIKLDGISEWISGTVLKITSNFQIENIKTQLIYPAVIYPFYARPIPIFYHKNGKEKTIENLTEISKSLSEENRKKIENLIHIVKRTGGNDLTKISAGKNIVVYRGIRACIAATIITKDYDLAIYHNCVAYECENPEMAYYYSALLNFFVEKLEKRFLRFNAARPLQAICETDLIWKNQKWQKEIANLSKLVHDIASNIYTKEYEDWINRKKIGKREKIMTKKLLSLIKENNNYKNLISKFEDHIDDSVMKEIAKIITLKNR